MDLGLKGMKAMVTGGTRGIDQTPPAAAIEAMRKLCDGVLERARAEFRIPIIPASGYRSPELNRAIGGADKSQHCVGAAVDFEIASIPNVDVARWISRQCQFDQVILECYDPKAGPNSGWVHCSFVDWPDARGEVLTYSRTKGYTPGLPA
jgi:hypothetical protein